MAKKKAVAKGSKTKSGKGKKSAARGKADLSAFFAASGPKALRIHTPQLGSSHNGNNALPVTGRVIPAGTTVDVFAHPADNPSNPETATAATTGNMFSASINVPAAGSFAPGVWIVQAFSRATPSNPQSASDETDVVIIVPVRAPASEKN